MRTNKISEPGKSNQGMECGCRVYFDGAFKVDFCALHGASLDMLAALRNLVVREFIVSPGGDHYAEVLGAIDNADPKGCRECGKRLMPCGECSDCNGGFGEKKSSEEASHG